MDEQSKIDEFRSIVRKAYESDKESFDLDLIELMEKDDWAIRRYLERRKTVAAGAEMLINTLKFRNKYNISQMSDVNFPAEYFKMGLVFDCTKDKQGNDLMYMRHRFYRKFKDLDLIWRQFLIYQMDRIDKKSNRKGMAIIVDLNNISMDNTDLDYARWGMKTFGDCCPISINYVLLYNLPRVMITVWNMVKSLLPKDLAHLMKFCNGDEIFDYVDRKNLPKYLGGDCQLNHYQVPADCLPLEEFGHQKDWSQKHIDKILKTWKPYLEKAENEMKLLQQ
ncbi:motile sperm domain-containing protein 2-like protein [Euroglyphus maynei]|uniref:Motile sperm domain-containing protein 2-like protein n=1 Tax=Euroglyphus maynei TaxID=6958 RepID=A0A1Y3BM37_EURMA|nr:motile sperm domain-containing protein 2-like protein [Euroglyphus maynei]